MFVLANPKHGRAESDTGDASGSRKPQLTLSAAKLNFGNVTLKTATERTLTLTSSGTAPVTINSASIGGPGFAVLGAHLPVTLYPTQSTTLEVQFDPASAGTVSGQLAIISTSQPGSTSTVALTGVGVAASSPQLSLSATALSFGNVTANSSATKSLTLSSTGTAPLTVSSVSITGTGFKIIAGSFPVTLNPAQSTTLQVEFSPTVAGTDTGQLTIQSNSSSGSSTAVGLTGTGTTISNPQLTLSAATLNFSNVPVETSTMQALTLSSSGTSPLTVYSVTSSGAEFSVVAGSLPATLNPGQALSVQVKFTPTTSGSATGQITVDSNSGSGSTTIVSLKGTGTAAASPQLSVSSTNISFGNAVVNSTSTQNLTLTSTGTSAVTVNSATVSGTAFSITGSSFPLVLNAGQTATLQIRFLPTAVGADSGQITISSNSLTGSSTVVSLSGDGTAAPKQIDLSWDAPASSPDPVVGYNVYRSQSSGAFTKINSSPQAPTSFIDNSVLSGTSYSYYVTSVDSSAVESVPSNQITISMP